MANENQESPLLMEEILLLWGYRVHFKDADVCSMIDPQKRGRPICISKKPGAKGLSSDIVKNILFDARIDQFQYEQLLAKAQAKMALDHERNSR